MKYPYSEMLVLPEVVAKEQVAKRFVREVDTSSLITKQKEYFDEMTKYASGESVDYDYLLLEGYAGTGKTYLTSMVTEWILHNTGQKVAVTAPTNKAVKVLKDAGLFTDSNLEYSTIHSLLGLREQITGYGEQIFIQNSKEDARIGQYDVIFIDETSMLSDDLLLGAKKITGIIEYAKMLNIKLIFIGDPCQIPPIGKDQSSVMTPEYQDKLKIKVLKLTDIVRQSADNPIIKVTLEVRNALGRDVVLPVRESDFSKESFDGVHFMNYDDKEEFESLLTHYFTSENFRDDANFCKVVAYTNKVVNYFNKKIRLKIFGENVGKITVGEKLIANKPIIDGNDVIKFTTNDEFEVQSYNVVTGEYKGAELTYYDTVVCAVGASGIKTETVKIIHENSEEDFKLILNYLVELANKEKKGSWEAAARWKDYFAIQTVFADINYNYAITAHKSQGSTYENCFVIESDIDKLNRIKERNRIKYTAFTRPKRKLFIVE